MSGVQGDGPGVKGTEADRPKGEVGRGQREVGQWRRPSPILGCVMCLIAGVLIGRLLEFPFPSANWWDRFLTSAGFAGSMAVIAACIAGRTTWTIAKKDRDQRDRVAQRDHERYESSENRTQWWARAKWVMDLMVHEDAGKRTVGFRAAGNLASSKSADDEDVLMLSEAVDALIEVRYGWGVTDSASEILVPGSPRTPSS